ncbi:heparinase II/III-family protein [Jeotgalibaca sp. MA1X17-3]|uniref:heparinase II/III domain-containing protein n=1 Tax=Jeotgalibaca sp. MA1X17-3 TaxID=2908211 RepID=UPI001F338D6F|nr:heparinase II/III family protein [Jeotgalibaca sp. MA1X17-3]UJF15695.1 heparinase II/III-family protein [Jeotgalibaca sp. MA1X17-3]
MPFEEKEWEWERLENNWSAVIAGCIGMTALSLLPYNSDRQNQIIKRLETSFDRYLSSFGEDGACVEGVAYWSYGFGYYCYFAQKYQEKFKDDKYLANTKLKAIASFPYYTHIGKERFIPFSDSHDSEIPSGLLTFCRYTYKVRTPSVSKINSLHFDHCYRWAPLYRNLIWTEVYEEEEASFCHYFKNSEWLIVKNVKENFVFATKGGRNDESHNHNDSGHFLIGNLDELFLTDFGAGEYTKDYFDDNHRYHFLHNRSLGHSVPIVNGQEQQFGEFGAIHAKYQELENKILFSVDLQEVYTQTADILSYKRTWKYNPEQREIELEDQLKFATERENAVIQNFVSGCKPIILNNSVHWIGKNDELILHFQANEEEAFVLSEQIKTHGGEEVLVYRTELRSKKEGGTYHRKYVFRLEKL